MEITKERLLWMYRTMCTIREFEERAMAEVSARRTFGGMHSSAGQEAVPTGICAHLGPRDAIASTHRGHGHCIAKGVDPRLMMAELFGRSTGTNKGKGGSMHIADMGKGMLGANGVVGASVPLAVGAALAARLRGEDRVAVAFFGDGAANQGVIHESMNLAAIWRLPVIFVCENNLYAESTPVEYSSAVPDLARRAAAYNMPGVIVDGMDVLDVYDKAGVAIGRARAGQGPTFLECKTYRFYGHFSGDNPRTYRTEEEERAYRARDPIPTFRRRLLEEKVCTPEELDSIQKQVVDLIEEAVRFADQSPLPPPEEVLTDVYVTIPRDWLVRGTGLTI
ncbi:MAG: thiamine pyrophosphate-dependent dehydrogenase E1 component subunit alpha [Chloroflexota bacterium]|nr:thiamine pyrophosphate-dependent dehydrogenase E1 component subunit alpha [Chloroflexota bacterium]